MVSLGCASLLLLPLLFSTNVFADDLTTTTLIIPEEEVEEAGELVTEGNKVDEMRDQSVAVVTSSRNAASSKTPKNVSQLETGFMPSVHLGPIVTDQQRQTTKLSPFNVGPLLFPDEHKSSPFNSLSAIKFGDGKDILSSKPSNSAKLDKIQESAIRPSEKDASFVKFVDEAKDRKEQYKEKCAPAHKIGTTHRQLSEPIFHQHANYLAETSTALHHHPQTLGYAEESYDNGHQQYSNYEIKPTKYDTTPIVYSPPYHQPVGPHHEPYHHHNEATIMKPEMIINVQHPMSFQASTYDPIQKPKTVIYVTHEPHQYYHQSPPPSFNHLDFPEHEETYPIYYDQPHQKSISPWKKILHIIGAFLPLGLLFALLPNVIKPNTIPNNPSIVLSKLRVNDLAAEHKRDRLALDTECREERTICRLLAAADHAGFDFLRSLVLRIAEKTAESSVRKKELDRIFEAAKLGNCDILTCNFYDGT